MADNMFTEHTLLADIIAKWGDYGAHADVFRSMLAEIERLRAAGDALAEALHGWCNGMDAFTDDWERLRVWQEARRG